MKHDIDLTSAEFSFALSQLIKEVEKVKVLFSERRLADVNLKIHGRVYSIKVTRKRFNDICEAIVRYYNTNWPIPIEWIEEYNDLITEGYFTEIKKGALK